MSRQRAADRAKVTADNYFAMVPEWVLYAQVSSTAVRLYAVLARIANDSTAEGYAKRQTLAERLAGKDGEPVSVKTVDRATAELEAIGAVVVIPQFDACGDRRENLYRVVTQPPGVATPESGGGDIDVPTRRHQCPDGDDNGDATVATPVSLQGKQSPLTRALEPEIATSPLPLHRARAETEEEEQPNRSPDERLLHWLVQRVEQRLGFGSMSFFWNTSDVGGRIELSRVLADLVAGGWPEFELIDRIADGCHPGMESPVAVLLTIARSVEPAPPDVAHRDELKQRRLEPARTHARVLAAAITDPVELLDKLCAEYGQDGALLEAAFAAAGLDRLGRPLQEVGA